MAEEDKTEYHRVKVAAMQCDPEESKAKNRNSTSKDNHTINPHSQEGQQSNQKSKRKRKKKTTGESEPVISGKETLPFAEGVKPELGSSMQQFVHQCKSEIKSRAFRPKDFEEKGIKKDAAALEDIKASKAEAGRTNDLIMQIQKIEELKNVKDSETLENIKKTRQEGQQANLESKRKWKNKISDKSEPTTSRMDTLRSAEDVKPKLDPLMQQLLKQRISEIQLKALDKKNFTYGGKMTYKNASNSKTDLYECSKGNTGHNRELKIKVVRPIPFDFAMTPESTSTAAVSAESFQKSGNLHQNKVNGAKAMVKSTSANPPIVRPYEKEFRNLNGSTSELCKQVESFLEDFIIERKGDEISGKGTWEAKSLRRSDYDGGLLSKDDHVKMASKDIKSSESIIPNVHVMDKATHIDPVQENPCSSENPDNINFSTPNSDSECTVMAEELGTTLPPDASNVENISNDIDHHTNLNTEFESLQVIKEEFKGINISTLNSNSECAVMSEEPGTTLPPNASNVENVSKEIDHHLNTECKSLQDIREEFKGLNMSTFNSDLESTDMAEESGTTLPPHASNVENVSTDIDHHTNLNTEFESLQGIREEFKGINMSTLNSNSQCAVMAEESGTTLPPDVETVSKDIDNYTSCSIEGESFQSIKEDFLRELKIANEKFIKNFMKSYEDMK